MENEYPSPDAGMKHSVRSFLLISEKTEESHEDGDRQSGCTFVSYM